jgi:hypothetical protein
MGSTTTAISIDRFRRRKATAQAPAHAAHASHPLVGTTLGLLERRYGLMASEEPVNVGEVIATSGDLAVADRLAFVASMERRVPIVVIELEGWYLACATTVPLAASELPLLRAPEGGAPRIMSVASERGITPALGPLVA